MATWRTALTGLATVILVAGMGCEGGAPTGISGGKVTGQAKLQGKPLDKAFVVLVPTEAGQAERYGKASNGTFELDNVAPGKYKAQIDPEWKRMGTPAPASSSIPKKYTDATTANVEVTVPSGGTSELRIEFN